MSTCEHPPECGLDNNAGIDCAWCEEVRVLKNRIKDLRDQFRKTAVVVAGGEVNIYGDIGYIEQYGGMVNQRIPEVKLPSGD